MRWQGRSPMRRRDFISLLGSAAAAWPLPASAQQPATPMIGFLSYGTFENTRDYIAAFHRSLADGGFAEGRNVGIEYRWSEDHNDRLPGTGRGFGSRSGNSHR